MALNWTMLDPKRTPVPLPDEVTITVEDNAELIVTIPNAPPSQGSVAGSSEGNLRLKALGRVYLTDQRFIFVSPTERSELDSLSVPLASILATSFQQPLFGSNYLTFNIKPAVDGGLTEGTTAELRLKDRGLFSFVSSLEKSRERAIYMKRQAASDADTLPLYDPPSASSTPEPSNQGTVGPLQDVPAEAPPGYDA